MDMEIVIHSKGIYMRPGIAFNFLFKLLFLEVYTNSTLSEDVTIAENITILCDLVSIFCFVRATVTMHLQLA